MPQLENVDQGGGGGVRAIQVHGLALEVAHEIAVAQHDLAGRVRNKDAGAGLFTTSGTKARDQITAFFAQYPDHLELVGYQAALVAAGGRRPSHGSAHRGELEHLIACLHSALPDMRSQASTLGREFELAGVVYFCADTRYTRVVTDGLEAHIRLSLRELSDALDPAAFWQVHRGYMVAVRRIASAARAGDGALWLHLRGHKARLPVSQRFQHLFRGM